MSTLPTHGQEGQSAASATSLNLPQTGYLSSTTDQDWFKLPSLTGSQEISVLPDLGQVVYSISFGSIVANQPYLQQETSVSASIYAEYNYNGQTYYADVADLAQKSDTIAMAGRTVLSGDTITFADTTYNFQGAHQSGSIYYTGNYFIKVSGQPIPLLAEHSSDYTQNYSTDAGRYLVTFGAPTGQRSSAWGGDWINTIPANGGNATIDISNTLVPDSIYNQSSSFDFATTSAHNVSASHLYTINSDGSWIDNSLPSGAAGSSGIDPTQLYESVGVGIWRKSIETGWDKILDLVETAGGHQLRTSIQDAVNVGKIVTNYYSNLMGTLDRAIQGKESPAQIDNDLNMYELSLKGQVRDYLKGKVDDITSSKVGTNLVNLINLTSVGGDPPVGSHQFQAFAYSSSSVSVGIRSEATFIGANTDMYVGGSTLGMLVGNYQNETLHLGGKLSDYTLGGVIYLNYSLTPNETYVFGGPEKATLLLSHIQNIKFSDGEIVFGTGNQLVNPIYYAKQNADVFHAGLAAGTHYDQYGWHEGRDPNAFFSTTGYLAANRDVVNAGFDPLNHYDAIGWKEGRDPSAKFDNELYLLHNPDVKSAGIDPLAHYLQSGQAEGRQAYAAIGNAASFTHGSFDPEYYLLANPDVAKVALASGSDTFAFAFQHYTNNGAKEGRMPDAFFDPAYYLLHNLDVAAAHINPLTHYDQIGWKEGRDPSAAFHTNAYLAANPDVAAAHIDPLTHYLQYGADEGRHLA